MGFMGSLSVDINEKLSQLHKECEQKRRQRWNITSFLSVYRGTSFIWLMSVWQGYRHPSGADQKLMRVKTAESIETTRSQYHCQSNGYQTQMTPDQVLLLNSSMQTEIYIFVVHNYLSSLVEDDRLNIEGFCRFYAYTTTVQLE